jgi:glycine hydroxymethyltransferase
MAQLIDSAVFPGLQGGPHDHITAAKAVAFSEAMRPEFKTYAGQIVKNAKAMADELMSQGIKLVTNGTDNHLMVIDMRPSGLTGKGKQLQSAMDEAGITLNKNSVPFDEARPYNPSGLRLGTPAVTTRGMKEGEMRVIASCIARVLGDYKDKSMLERTRQEIVELVSGFPLYPDFTVLE